MGEDKDKQFEMDTVIIIFSIERMTEKKILDILSHIAGVIRDKLYWNTCNFNSTRKIFVLQVFA